MKLKELVQELLKLDLTKEFLFRVEIEVYDEKMSIVADEIEIKEETLTSNSGDEKGIVIELQDPDIE